MQILIVGLGLIGASFAKALNKKHQIFAIDKDKSVLDEAISQGVIAGAAKSAQDYSFVIVALPPQATIDFLTQTQFAKNAIVTDVCGVKQPIIVALENANFNYVGTHPMAGKEKGGFENSSQNLFENASLILIKEQATCLKSLETVKQVYLLAGFTKTVVCDAAYHDKVIAYTSQLAHVVSNAYVKSPMFCCFKGFTGGSFQDMTRIAAMDEKLWTELFLFNRKNLSCEIQTLITNLQNFNNALNTADKELLSMHIKQGQNIKAKVNIDK